MKNFLFFLIGIFIVVSPIISLQAAEIISLEGKVEVQSDVDARWKTATVGEKIDIGYFVRTASQSKATIALDKARKQLITVEEESFLIFSSTGGKQINQIALGNGLIYANVEKIREGLTFEVHTPSSVAGVRGTGWSVDSVDERDEIACYEDQVYAQAYDRRGNLISEVTIDEGFEVFIERFEAPSEFIEISQDKEVHWQEWKEEVHEAVEALPPPPSDESKSDDESDVAEAVESEEGYVEDAADICEEVSDLGDIQAIVEDLSEMEIEEVVEDTCH
jgi:hypothetical protein